MEEYTQAKLVRLIYENLDGREAFLKVDINLSKYDFYRIDDMFIIPPCDLEEATETIRLYNEYRNSPLIQALK